MKINYMKWTIQMTQEELKRKTYLDKAIDRRMTQKAAAEILGISERQVRRLIRRYRQDGSKGLVSLQRGKPSNRSLKEELVAQIRQFIHQPIMAGFKPTFMREKLAEATDIKVSKETLRKLMIRENLHIAKAKKPKCVHPPRERRERRGELVQIDGSYHAWLEDRGPKGCLLLFVDDAGSELLAGEFVKTESYFSYGKLCKRYFQQVGVPVAFYSDRFSVFRDNHTGPLRKDSITQFQRALNHFGVDLICANSPQAKGRVERANKTCQDRLVNELRLRNICTYAEANAYLPEFIRDYNQRFAVQPASLMDDHLPLDPQIDLDFIFSIHDSRTLSKDLLLHYAGTTYQVLTKRNPVYLAKREVLVTVNDEGLVSAWLDGVRLELKQVDQYARPAPVVDLKHVARMPVSPPVNHPWRTYGKKLNGKPTAVIN
ncbi:MAG: ISNCY family transposase [Candidatus Paceibacterota bacterium]|jgi:transposase